MEPLGDKRFRFGEFELDCARRSLTREGNAIDLKAKSFDLLYILVANRGKILTKNELLDLVWPDQFVEENNLTVQISALRRALGDSTANPRFIATIPGKGYTFRAEVTEIGVPEVVIERKEVTRIVRHEETIEEIVEDDDATIPEGQLALPAATGNTNLGWGYRWGPIAAIATAALLIAGVGAMLLAERFGWISSGTQQPLRLQRLTTFADVGVATVTPDGTIAVFSRLEPGGESLWLRDIETGGQQMIRQPDDINFIGLAVSPDGRYIYATTFAENRVNPRLIRLPLLGGAEEEIANIATGGAVSFSPTGDRIAFTESRSSLRQTHLYVSGPDGSDKRLISAGNDGERSFPNFSVNSVAWSPDGGTIAAAVVEKGERSESFIVIIDPVNGSERRLPGGGWDMIDHVTWLDSGTVAFVAYTLEPYAGQIWSISTATGQTVRLTNDLSSYSWLAAAGGKMVSVQRNPISEISSARFDADAAQIVPRQLLKETGYIDTVAYTSDGRIIYSSSSSGKREIWRMDRDGSERTQLTSGANLAFGISVSPRDGSIVFGASEQGRYRLRITDADGKNMRNLTDADDELFPRFSPDGGHVYFQSGLNDRVLRAMRFSFSGRTTSELYRGYAKFPIVSPDGGTVAFYFMDTNADGLWKIGLVPSGGGEIERRIDFPRSVESRRMAWHPNGEFIGQLFTEGAQIGLLLLPVDGGPAKEIRGLGAGTGTWFDWSPGGDELLISTTQNTSDVVVLSPGK